MQMFGWRPNQSCYQGSTAQAKQTCPPVTWFYLLLGASVAWGIFSGKGGGRTAGAGTEI